MYRSCCEGRFAACRRDVLLVALILGHLTAAPAPGQVRTAPASDPARNELPELLGTSKSSFEIPFSISPSDQQTVQVVLHVSTDQGVTWKPVVSRSPTDKSFPYVAAGEGEYWFAIQSIHRDGTKRPDDRWLRPELRIAVDRKQPELEFSVRSDPAGRIIGSVTATDANIHPRSLVIEYQAAGDPATSWHTVPAESSRTATGGRYQDELAWWPSIRATGYAVRATISDVAGNPVSVTRQIVISGSAPGGLPAGPPLRPTSSPTASSAPSTSDSVIQTHYQQTRMPVALEHLYGDAPDPNPASAQTREAALRGATGSGSPPPPPSEQKPPGESSPAVNLSQSVANLPQERAAENASVDTQRAPPRPASRENENLWRSRPETGTAPDPGSQIVANTTLAESERVAANPAVENAPSQIPSEARDLLPPKPDGNPAQARVADRRADSPPRQDSPAQGSAPLPVPPLGTMPQNAVWTSSTTGERSELPPPRAAPMVEAGPEYDHLRKIARHSSSRQFQMDYEINAIGPEGARDVELWVTADGARSWQKLAHDSDCRSPANLAVDADGIYGFRIRVISNEGLSSRTPREGDPADVWVNVDTAIPEARLVAAPYGNGRDAGKLMIQWEARDSNLGIHPVRLLYSTGPEGPWTTIVNAAENTGEYAWQPAIDTPEIVFLRVEIRDEAGNVGADQVRSPVDLSGLIPRGQIRGITPIAPPRPTT